MNKYLRHGKLPIDMVIDCIKVNNGDPKAKLLVPTGHNVGISSLRLRTFARARSKLCCVSCGIEARFFSIDSFHNQPEVAHLNLMAVDESGKEVLMTCDHIQARALGGADNLSNTQVMCSPCNNSKSRIEGHEVNARRYLQNSNPTAKMIAIMAAQANPYPIEMVEDKLNRWAKMIDSEKFAKRVDDFLYKMGWKRRAVKQLIDEGKIKFDIYALRG